VAGPLHVTNGDSTRMTLETAGLGGDVLAWRDALWLGPVTHTDPDALRPVRATFLAAAGWAPREVAEAEMRRRDETLRAALGRRPVVLWFEHDLYDQLQLLQVLSFVGAELVGDERLTLIVVDRFAGHPSFAGLGELDARELASLWPARRTLTAAEHRLAADAWRAVAAPDPTALAALAGDGSDGPGDGLGRLLRPALRRLLEELPGTGGGLSRTERQVLEALRDGAATALEVFLAGQRREEAPFAGDRQIWDVLGALSAPPAPLVTCDGEIAAGGRVALTDAGRAVLDGRADAVGARGADRWVGGVRLEGRTVRWRWDAASGRLAEQP